MYTAVQRVLRASAPKRSSVRYGISVQSQRIHLTHKARGDAHKPTKVQDFVVEQALGARIDQDNTAKRQRLCIMDVLT